MGIAGKLSRGQGTGDMRYGRKHAIWRGWLAAACLLVTGPVAAAPESRIESEVAAVEAAAEDAYIQALAHFDQAMAQAPRDASVAVERCEFIQRHTDPESGRYLPRAEADAEACDRSLDAWATAPETQVYRFEQDWDDEARKRGDALLARAESWPPALRRRLAAGLADRYRYAEDADARAQELAILAADLGDGSYVASAVAALAKTGKTKRALALLDRAPPADSDWGASERVRAALDLPLDDAARRELQRQQKAGWQSPLSASSVRWPSRTSGAKGI